ncbi:monoacylglycerol lipase [[Candida] railenensis]|uniref:Monoacylglycerol lipase n=1 Tax=[Candida] railenensis TaxID=45579 RepID=A0A9P0QQ82_9ASCO|nr:monoacylglycerol lipase [[Candida] railenensis]
MLWSKVDNTEPANPITFTSAKTPLSPPVSTTLPQIVKNVAPEFYVGSSFFVNPLLASGHLQTAYTALRQFDDIDLVHYGRRLIEVDPENRGYKVEGERILYDKYGGKSTFTIDIVRDVTANVNPESSSLTVASVLGSDDAESDYKTAAKNSERHYAAPTSQDTTKLPPRTFFITEQEEKELLSDSSKPLLIALHGLSGGSYESYVRSILSEITDSKYGFDALVLNSRGCAGHTPTTPQLFNALWTNDVRYLVNEIIAKKYPEKKIFLIGFSLGGAIVGNFLAQEGDNIYKNIMGASIVGAPWDFMDSNVQLDNSILGNKVYSPAMSQNLQKLLHAHKESIGSEPNINQYYKNPDGYNLEKLHDFDEAFTSKFFGFNNHREYYRHSSPIQRLRKIRVPTLIVSAIDDPVIGNKTLPYYEVRDNPYTFLVTSTIGGHLGWFKFGGERWYPKPISKIFHDIFNNWKVNKPQPDTLPVALESKIWKYDRLIVGQDKP